MLNLEKKKNKNKLINIIYAKPINNLNLFDFSILNDTLMLNLLFAIFFIANIKVQN